MTEEIYGEGDELEDVFCHIADICKGRSVQLMVSVRVFLRGYLILIAAGGKGMAEMVSTRFGKYHSTAKIDF